jgi:hypothetical protein
MRHGFSSLILETKFKQPFAEFPGDVPVYMKWPRNVTKMR